MTEQMTVPEHCPVCEIKNNGQWIYLCPKCWKNFMLFVRKIDSSAYGSEQLKYLHQYLSHLKVKVQFT